MYLYTDCTENTGQENIVSPKFKCQSLELLDFSSHSVQYTCYVNNSYTCKLLTCHQTPSSLQKPQSKLSKSYHHL